MSTLLKKLAIVALIASIAPTLAMARVKPLHEYKQGIKNVGGSTGCGSGVMSEYPLTSETTHSCAIVSCTSNTVGSLTCYKCSLSNNYNTYPFEEGDCDKTGLKVTASCKVNNTTYQMCGCDSGYYSAEDFGNKTDVVPPTPVTADGKKQNNETITLTCYSKDGWTCKNGTKKAVADLGYSGALYTNTFSFSSTKDNSSVRNYIKYSAVANTTDLSIATVCVTNAESTDSELLYTSTPSSINCVKNDGAYTAALYSKTFYYYTGCGTSGNCLEAGDTAGTCGSTATNGSGKYGLINGTKTSLNCKEATGCNVGKVATNAFCYGSTSALAKVYNSSGAASASYSGGVIGGKFAATTESVGNYTCVKITGCTGDYTTSTTSISDTNLSTVYDANASSTTTLYDAAIAYNYSSCTTPTSCSNTTDRLICRMPTACRTDSGYYDTTCDTGCWEGFLSWFMPQ